MLMQQVVNDEFFTISNHELYLDEIQAIMGENLHYRQIANSFHFLLGHEHVDDALTTKQQHFATVLNSFAKQIFAEEEYPMWTVSSEYSEDGNSVTLNVTIDNKFAANMLGYQAITGHTPDMERKDFRVFDFAGFMAKTPNRAIQFLPNALTGQEVTSYTTAESMTLSTTISASGSTYSATFFKAVFMINGNLCEVGSPAFVVPYGYPFPDGMDACIAADSCAPTIEGVPNAQYMMVR